ncbi:NADH-quinone oxidoreductase subunit C [Desulfovibrio sp. OttesenSCG-928-I05]|nr:NADH-quinone oxidoreductase subunit C [Desulfovibrio sp. OttesenSCG-928-I05]
MIPAPFESLELLYLAKDNAPKTGSAWLAFIEPKTLPAMAEAFLAAHYHLEDVSGLEVAEGAVSVYHFDHFDTPGRITVAAVAPHDAPAFPSIAPVYHGAEWHERETRDFYGFSYEGNPNFIPLLLADDMADVHPLQKAEESRAALRTLFAAENRGGDVVKKAEGFTLLDAPAPEPEAVPEPVVEAAPAAAPVAEKPVAQAAEPVAESAATPAAEAPQADSKPEEKATPAASAPAPKAPVKPVPSPKKSGGKSAKGGRK